jgi:histidinol-phosphate aminotransferase
LKVEHIRAAVESHGVLLRYFHHPYLSDFVRVTVGRPEHTDVLATALAQVMARS